MKQIKLLLILMTLYVGVYGQEPNINRLDLILIRIEKMSSARDKAIKEIKLLIVKRKNIGRKYK